MDAQIKVHFSAPVEQLPEPLPTIAEILSSQETLDNRDNVLVRVGKHYVVKYGPRVDRLEGENMIFVRNSTSIPVPAVYAIFSGSGNTFIVMAYIPGSSLKSLWDQLDIRAKKTISRQLRQYFDELRALPTPGYFGGLQRTGLLDPMFGHVDAVESFRGPHDTEEQLAAALIHKERYTMRHTPDHELVNFHQRALHTILRGHASVFTHGDFHPGNVIIQDDGGVCLIDWGWAGWYPSCWEYSNAILQCGLFKNDWHVWIHEVLDPFMAEYAWLAIIRERQFCGW